MINNPSYLHTLLSNHHQCSGIAVDQKEIDQTITTLTSQSRQWKRSRKGGGPHRGEVAELDPSLNFRLLGLGLSEGSCCSLEGVASGGKGAIAPGCSHLRISKMIVLMESVLGNAVVSPELLLDAWRFLFHFLPWAR